MNTQIPLRSLNPQPSTLNQETLILQLCRQQYSHWGVDGKLYLEGEHLADTTEHPTHHLQPGTYPIKLGCMFFKRGNGPMLNIDGSICVGELLCPGCVLKSHETFTPLYNRIQKALRRGHQVQLIINDCQ